MNEAEAEPDDIASLRLAAQLPITLMVVGAVPALASQHRELAQEGYNVITAATVAQALARHEQDPCSVILVGSHLPDGTCRDLIASIRAQSHSSYVYLIAQVVDESNIGRDADDWVTLSSSREDLLKRLRAARRIVTLERSCRVGNDTTRLRELAGQAFGIANQQTLASEAVRHRAEPEQSDRSIAPAPARPGPAEESGGHLAHNAGAPPRPRALAAPKEPGDAVDA